MPLWLCVRVYVLCKKWMVNAHLRSSPEVLPDDHLSVCPSLFLLPYTTIEGIHCVSRLPVLPRNVSCAFSFFYPLEIIHCGLTNGNYLVPLEQ